MLPILWKAGVKTREQVQKFEDDQLAKRFDYAPGGGAAVTPGAWATYPSPWPYDLGMNDAASRRSPAEVSSCPNLRATRGPV